MLHHASTTTSQHFNNTTSFTGEIFSQEPPQGTKEITGVTSQEITGVVNWVVIKEYMYLSRHTL